MYNPSLEGWVKIGYADNVEKIVQQLNSHETTPYAFRIYATYEAHERLQDKSLHKLIDQLDSTFVNHGLILYKWSIYVHFISVIDGGCKVGIRVAFRK